MFQLFSHHSSASNRDQTALRMNENVLHKEVALSGERPATYDEILPWLLAPCSASDPPDPPRSFSAHSASLESCLSQRAPTRLQHRMKETLMITSFEALFDISLAVASAALTVAVFAILVELVAMVRQRAMVLLQRPQDSVRMQ